MDAGHDAGAETGSDMGKTIQRAASIVSRGARYHFGIGVVLVCIIPLLTMTYLMFSEGWEGYLRDRGELVLVLFMFGSAALGISMLRKYPASIVALRRHLEGMVRGELPDRVSLKEPEDDISAIERCMNTVVGDLKQRVALMRRENERLERELQQVEKLKAIGIMAASVAQEISTPVQVVRDNIEFLGRATRDLGEIAKAAGQVLAAEPDPARAQQLREALRLDDLTYVARESVGAIADSRKGLEGVAAVMQSMKAFSHAADESRSLVDLNTAVTTAVTVTRDRWRYVADVALDLDPALPGVPGVWADISQVLIQLILSAATQVSRSVDNGRAGKGFIRLASRQEGEWARVTLSHSGALEAAGESGGLGVIQSLIVKKHAGSFSAEPAPGGASTYVIRLPIEAVE